MMSSAPMTSKPEVLPGVDLPVLMSVRCVRVFHSGLRFSSDPADPASNSDGWGHRFYLGGFVVRDRVSTPPRSGDNRGARNLSSSLDDPESFTAVVGLEARNYGGAATATNQSHGRHAIHTAAWLSGIKVSHRCHCGYAGCSGSSFRCRFRSTDG